MRGTPYRKIGLGVLGVLVSAFLGVAPSEARIDGLTGTSFSLVAASGYIQNGDGNTLFFWGFSDGSAPSGIVQVQYPGPTLIVNQGDTVTVRLFNWLAEPVSLVFPGMDNVTATPAGAGIRGIFTWEAPPGGGDPVTYAFTASRPGTFYYQSGTNMDKQLEMGLFGAIIVRPAGFNDNVAANRTAYGDATSRYDREYLFLLTEMDDRYHNQVERGQEIDTTTFFPTYWFINGRNSPDTMAEPNVPQLPTQPYNSLPMLHPGEKALFRIVTMGRDQHPFHHHSNHSLVIAWDARPLTSDPANFAALGADLAEPAFSVMAAAGRTSDSIFTWTGRELGWDVYGTGPEFVHNCIDVVNNETGAAGADGFADPGSDHPYEWCPDHGLQIPVNLPPQKDVEPGDFYSGSPYLGAKGILPPGRGIFNIDGSFFHITHSHSEKEMTTNNVFPGGMMTFTVIVPYSSTIP